MDRVIGKYKGAEDGPLLVITAGMHGNEPAGVKALELLFKMLEVEPITNPDFVYKGEIIGIIGNLSAFQLGKRFISKDINRCWEPDYINKIKDAQKSFLKDEDLEIKEILDAILHEINRLSPTKMFLLDLHTTSSDGGIFCIAAKNKESIDIAHDLHAPVVLGLMDGISGTTLHYFNQANLGIPTVAIAFEGGQHDDAMSVNRCIAATINFMRTIGTIKAEHVENRHDHILLEYCKSLPEIVEVKYKYHIENNHVWQMKPGFHNFKAVKKGDVLARDNGQLVTSPIDGLILMPLYQSQGEDGFFIVKDLKI